MPAKRIRKTGLPPGSLIYTGVQKSDVIIKELVRYNAEYIDELDSDTVPPLDHNFFFWLDIRGLHNPQEIEAIGQSYGLDPLLLEDILDTSQRPKCEQTDQGIFMILKHLQRSENGSAFNSEQISFYLTEGRLITFQEFPDDTFHALKVRMQQAGSRLRSRRPDYLMYAIIDFISDHYFPIIDHCSDRIHALDEAINVNPADELKKSIFHVRQDISEMHRIILPTREAVSTLQRIEGPLITEKTRRYLRDVMDNIMQILDLNDNQSDHLASLHDLFMSEMTYRMTNVMKILTVVTSIFIPLTFLTSIYGMNFKYQPEYNWPWAYGVLWMIMIIVGIIQVIYFKRKNWL
jgi:magnesium transporter